MKTTGNCRTPAKFIASCASPRAEESPLPDPSSLTDGVYATPEDLDTPHHK